MSIVSIKIPDLLHSPYITQPIPLNNQLYFFAYTWNIRHSRAYLSIYIKNNDELEYLVKNKCLIPGIEISKEINNKNWKGVLTFDKIWNGLQDDYRQDNINIEFDIKYILED